MRTCLSPNTTNGGNEWITGVYRQFEGVYILEHCARSNKSTILISTHIYALCPKGGHYA